MNVCVLGYWYMHCHTEFHNDNGMALYIKVGNHSQMNPPPTNINTCGNFVFSQNDILDSITNDGRVLADGGYTLLIDGYSTCVFVQENTCSVCLTLAHNIN